MARKIYNQRDTNYRSESFRRKVDSEAGNNTKSCTDSGWTEFYDIDFTADAKSKYFSELVFKCDNLDRVKIKIDGEEVLVTTINKLKKILVDDDGIQMKDIDVSYVNNISTLYLELNHQKGKRIRILQQKRNGTGDLTAKGYILTYAEKK